jgi:MFS family permease
MKNNLKKKLIKNNPIDVKDSQVDYATLQVQDESRSNRSIGEIKPISIPFKTILFTSIFLWAGAMSYYDFPQIYTQYLIDYFSVQNIDIEYLYSAVQVPNIILSLIASFIMDRTGLGLGNLIFQLIVMIGLIVNYYAFAQTNFLWMFIGRAIFGLGAEVTFVA